MSDGSNAAKGLPGYRKTLTGGFYPELFDAAAAAPPGLPYNPGDMSSPLTSTAQNLAPPQPDRYVRGLGYCPACGSSSFNGTTDAVSCPDCGQPARAMTQGLTAPGSPWF